MMGVFGLCAWQVQAASKVDIDYDVRLLPDSGQAEVKMTLEQGAAIRQLDFDLRSGQYSAFKAEGSWQLSADGKQAAWRPAPGQATLVYRVKLDHRLKNGAFDSRITSSWAVFRGELLVPPGSLAAAGDKEWVTRLHVELPPGWKRVEAPWPRIGKNRFRIDDPERTFDRPVGWIAAGHIASRRTQLGNTQVSVTGPLGQGVRRMDSLTLLTFVWPSLSEVFPREPGKLLIVSAGSPMWRGANGEGNSVFLGSQLPAVGETGVSPLLRECVKVISRIQGQDRSAWIAEGLAQYYAVTLLQRAGGLSDDRLRSIQARWQKQGDAVQSIRGAELDQAAMARTLVLLRDLDSEIRVKTRNKRSLDDLARAAMRQGSITTAQFVDLAQALLGEPSTVLDTPLLH